MTDTGSLMAGRACLTRRHMLLESTSVVALALAACRRGGPAPAEQPPATASKRPATVIVHSRAGCCDHSAFQQTRIPIFREQFPHIEIHYEDIPSAEIRTKLLVLAAGGSIGDLAWNSTWTGSHELLAKGVFQPIEPFIKADKFDLKPYFPASLDVQRYQGQLHGLPFIGHYGANAIYFNQELFERFGAPAPPLDANWTTDDLVERAKKIATAGGDEYFGFIPSVDLPEPLAAWLRTFGGEFLSTDGRRCLLNTAPSLAALQWLHDAIYKHRLASNYAQARQRFEQGKLAMIQATLGLVAEWRRPESPARNLRWNVTVIPRGPAGHRGTQGTGTGYALTALSKEREAAWLWLAFITNKENGVEQVFGGGGSPGARTDVWNDPRLLALNPIYSTMVRVFGQPGLYYPPANGRADELNKEVNAALQPLWEGKLSVREAAQAATEAAERILALPMA
jgi:multiple sugar transport system substrate-binding protein